MKVKYLFKLFHKLHHNEFQKHYEKRINFETSTRLPFFIQEMNSNRSIQLFYLPTNKMIEKITELYNRDKLLNELFRGLSHMAKDYFLFDCLVEELQNTNDIEGVKSTKEEIVRSAKELERNHSSTERFTSMINSYNKLLLGELRLLEKPQDVRKIYDYLVADEIATDELPDGEMNYFIDPFLEMICSSQGDMIEELKIKQQLLEDAINKIQNHPFLQKEKEIYKDIVFVFVQHHYFHPSNVGLNVQELAKFLLSQTNIFVIF